MYILEPLSLQEPLCQSRQIRHAQRQYRVIEVIAGVVQIARAVAMVGVAVVADPVAYEDVTPCFFL